MTRQIEERLADLEAEVARLKHRVDQNGLAQPWWEQIVGTFADNQMYEEAMGLGREYRCGERSQASDSPGDE